METLLKVAKGRATVCTDDGHYVTFRALVRAFRNEGVRWHWIKVIRKDNIRALTVQVWDKKAREYTYDHVLSDQDQDRLCMAATTEIERGYNLDHRLDRYGYTPGDPKSTVHFTLTNPPNPTTCPTN